MACPPELVVDVIQDFIDRPRDPEVRNYADWLNASYGETFARTFPMQYTRKYHTTPAENMSTEWVGPRLYQARLEEVLLGAVSPIAQKVHYVQDYRYPTHGGFASYVNGLVADLRIELNHAVTRIDPRARNGAVRQWRADRVRSPDFVDSAPDLIGLIAGAPRDVVEAAENLACTTVVLVNLGIDRADVSEASWTYFYDEEFPFSRLSFPRVYSPNVVPEGTSAIQAEVYFSKKYRPLTTVSRGGYRSGHRRADPLRAASPGRSHPGPPGPAHSLRQHHLRSGSRRGPAHRPRVPRGASGLLRWAGTASGDISGPTRHS
jgi:protoporphyrinogen oxidase